MEASPFARRQQIQAQLVARAQSDDAFRARLLADPKAAVAAELGVPLPTALTVDVVEETATSLTLVLPPATTELSEAELEQVAGGTKPPGGRLAPPYDL